MGDRAQLGGEPHRVGRVFGLALDEQRLDREPQAEPARHIAHLPQRRALHPVQPVELMRGPRRDHARMVDQDRGTDGGRQLQVRPAHRLVELEVGLIHEVDGQRAVGRVAQAPPATDGLQPPPRLGQHLPAGDQVGREQRKLGVAGAGILDPAQRPIEIGQVGALADGGETDARDQRLAHGGPPLSCRARRCGS